VWDAFCDAAALVNAKGFPDSTELLDDRRKYAPVEWQRPELEWVDVSAEQSSAESSLKTHTGTLQGVLGGKGLGWRSVLNQRAKEEKMRLKLKLFTPEERTAQMMAAQTQGPTQGPATDPATGEPAQAVATPPGAMMGLSTLQWNRNAKAILKTIKQMASGEITPVQAEVFLRAVEVPQSEIDLLINDASDGTIETPLPAEVVVESEVPIVV